MRDLIPYLDQVVHDIEFPEFPHRHSGKVRENYDIGTGFRLIIATDRLSAFDRHVTDIPFKGQILTSIAEFWFNQIDEQLPWINHHMLSEEIDPNVMLVEKLNMIPIEIVVRDYLAGNTSTSISTAYQRGMRNYCGVELPDGLVHNQKLPKTIITPTTKSADHDLLISSAECIKCGMVTKDEWDDIASMALELFDMGRTVAAQQGLILADTKYEFGRDMNGFIVLADEIHTPDSSRYWLASTYQRRLEAGEAPDSFDKDVVRRWIKEQCNPYIDLIPTIPPEVIAETATAYVNIYERLTGTPFTIPADTDPTARIQQNVRSHFPQTTKSPTPTPENAK